SFISITTPLVLVTNLSIANPGNSTLVIDSIQVNALEQLVFSTSSVSGTSSFPGSVFGAANDTLENPIVIPPLSVKNYQTELVIPVTSEFFQTRLPPQGLPDQGQFTFSVSYIELQLSLQESNGYSISYSTIVPPLTVPVQTTATQS
ncbi:MAG: hypothetical protein QXM17_08900, partial [Metallosphaera sp.]